MQRRLAHRLTKLILLACVLGRAAPAAVGAGRCGRRIDRLIRQYNQTAQNDASDAHPRRPASRRGMGIALAPIVTRVDTALFVGGTAVVQY